MNEDEGTPVYPTWRETIKALKACTTETQAMELIESEKAGGNRILWLTRMAGTYRELRNARLDEELRLIIEY